MYMKLVSRSGNPAATSRKHSRKRRHPARTLDLSTQVTLPAPRPASRRAAVRRAPRGRAVRRLLVRVRLEGAFQLLRNGAASARAYLRQETSACTEALDKQESAPVRHILAKKWYSSAARADFESKKVRGTRERHLVRVQRGAGLHDYGLGGAAGGSALLTTSFVLRSVFRIVMLV